MRISDWSSDVCSSDLLSGEPESLRGESWVRVFASRLKVSAKPRRSTLAQFARKPGLYSERTSPGDAFVSASIVGVDADVAMRQVARPHGGAAVAKADVDSDLDLSPLSIRTHQPFVIALSGHPVAPHPTQPP